MTEWKSMVAAAVLGSERQAMPQLNPGGILGDTIAAIVADQSSSKEKKFLSIAALLSVHAAAGTTASKSAVTAVTMTLDSEDDWMECSQRSAEQLYAALMPKSDAGLLHQWIESAVQFKKLAPPHMIPRLLDVATREGRPTAAIMKVVGVTGRSLAKLNSEWRQLSGDGGESDQPATATDQSFDSQWQTGLAAERLALLNRLRRTAPGEARGLVESTWSEDSPKDRQAFTDAFAIGLSMEDEPFLEEKALYDGRKEVRAAARSLLCRLKDSRYSMRMIQRTCELVTITSISGHEVSLSLPKECDKSMQRDGVEQKSVDTQLGDKQSWLCQMIGLINPDYWCEKFAMQPSELIGKAITSLDWQHLLLSGWTAAAQLHGSARWIEALFAVSAQIPEYLQHPDLLSHLSAEQREKAVTTVITNVDGFSTGKEPYRASYVLGRVEGTWSAAFTKLVLDYVKRDLSNPDKVAWELSHAILFIGHRGDTSLFPELDGRWDTKASNWPYVNQQVDSAIAFMRERRDIIAAMNS